MLDISEQHSAETATSHDTGFQGKANMHVLVTGGAGFIGSHIVDNLLARGYRVRVLDNLVTGSADYLPQHRDVEFIKGDVTDFDTCLRAMEGVEGVFHLAAMSKKDRVRKVVYAASSACYGSAPIPTHEDTWPLDNQTPYALTKYVAELY